MSPCVGVTDYLLLAAVIAATLAIAPACGCTVHTSLSLAFLNSFPELLVFVVVLSATHRGPSLASARVDTFAGISRGRSFFLCIFLRLACGRFAVGFGMQREVQRVLLPIIFCLSRDSSHRRIVVARHCGVKREVVA